MIHKTKYINNSLGILIGSCIVNTLRLSFGIISCEMHGAVQRNLVYLPIQDCIDEKAV